MAKDYDRSAAARKGWITRRANQKAKIESVIPQLKELNPQNVSGYSKKELLDIAKRGNLAVGARERDFREKYKQTTGTVFRGDFNREDFRVSQNTSIARLRHVVVMQKKFLERKNTFEDFQEQVGQFERRVRGRISILKEPEREGEEELSLGEKLQEREQEAETTLDTLEQERFKTRFFQLYEKALEMNYGGAEPSKGSPVFAKVGELLLENKNITLRELLDKLDEWYEKEQLENANRSNDITTADFLKVSANNNK